MYAMAIHKDRKNRTHGLAPVTSVLRFANLTAKPRLADIVPTFPKQTEAEEAKDRFFDYPFNELLVRIQTIISDIHVHSQVL